MRLPPGVSSQDFSSALSQFTNAVGKEWVFTSDDDVNTYRDSYSPFWHEDEEPIPSAAVAPDGVEQVQAVVKIANTFKIPLWIISTGKNLGYGGSAPLLGGSVVLDLKRMDRIIEVNEKNHYALVEPGVSYFDLYRYIQDKGLKVWIDPADPGWGSLIGNAVDRGGGRTPMRDHFDAHCGMEIVLPNGEVMRTGMGALPDSRTWQQYRYGFGPYVDGLFSQSSLGVVTKMGFWLFPQPEAYLTGTVTVMKRDDLIPLVAGLAYLMNSGMVLGTTSVANPLAFARQDPATCGALCQAGRRFHRRTRALCPGKGSGLLEHRVAVLRSGKSGCWRSGNMRKRNFPAIPGVKFKEGTMHRFPIKPDELPQFKFSCRGHPQPFGIRRGSAAQRRSRVVFSDYSHDGRGNP